MTTDVRVEVTDHVATVEICRPPNNFVDVALITQLADALDSLAAGDRCRVAVLCSQGKHFCAGANFQATEHRADPGPHLYDEALRLFEQPLPIVAAVQGAAIGGGLGLALAADCETMRRTAGRAPAVRPCRVDPDGPDRTHG